MNATKITLVGRKEPAKEPSPITATRDMCVHCFDVIIKELRKEPQTEVSKLSILDEIIEDYKCPLFITWDKEHRSDFRLRGCIGTLVPRPLKRSLGEYAITSAFRDHRFSPVRSNEVRHLRVGVSLLINYEQCDSCWDWDVGKHGIIIKFYFSGEYYNGTFLPEVCVEQNWAQQETVEHLVRKAGYMGEISNNLFASIHCSRYQSSKCWLTYNEYIKIIAKYSI